MKDADFNIQFNLDRLFLLQPPVLDLQRLRHQGGQAQRGEEEGHGAHEMQEQVGDVGTAVLSCAETFLSFIDTVISF